MYVTVCVLENDQKVFPWTMLLCSEEHAFAKLLENVKERVLGGNFEGAVITCTVSACTRWQPMRNRIFPCYGLILDMS